MNRDRESRKDHGVVWELFINHHLETPDWTNTRRFHREKKWKRVKIWNLRNVTWKVWSVGGSKRRLRGSDMANEATWRRAKFSQQMMRLQTLSHAHTHIKTCILQQVKICPDSIERTHGSKPSSSPWLVFVMMNIIQREDLEYNSFTNRPRFDLMRFNAYPRCIIIRGRVKRYPQYIFFI